MKLIIVTSAFLAIFCCFSQIEFTSARPTLGLDGILGGLPLDNLLQVLPIGSLLGGGGAGGLGGLGGLLGGIPLAGGLLGPGGTSQSNYDNIAISGLGNSYSKGIDLTGNLNALSSGLV